MFQHVFQTHSQKETTDFGRFLAQFLFPQSVITLSGDLGAGKTTFAGGVAAGLGVTEKVASPTFNIMKCYFNARLPLFHIDAYRLEAGTNKDLGLEEFIEGDGVALVEWPNYISEKIPSNALNIIIRNIGGDDRELTVTTTNPAYEPLFKKMKVRYK